MSSEWQVTFRPGQNINVHESRKRWQVLRQLGNMIECELVNEARGATPERAYFNRHMIAAKIIAGRASITEPGDETQTDAALDDNTHLGI